MRVIPFFSIKYWSRHICEASYYILTVFCGCALLSAMLLLMQSSKQLELEGYLTTFGNYDNSLMNVSVEYEEALASWDRIKQLGGYYELGYGSVNGDQNVRIGSFLNDASQELFYVACDQGRYPLNENELAIDETTAMEMGFYPEVGNTVLLTLTDDAGKLIGQKEFIISGIYTIRDNTRYGGYIRNANTRYLDYEYPVIFLSVYWKEQFLPDTAFFCWQVPDDEDTCTYEEISSCVREQLGTDAGFEYAKYVESNSRTIAYSDITQTMGAFMTRREFEDKLNDSNYAMDYYQLWLIPAVGALMFLLTFFSTYEAAKNIMAKRRPQIDIYRELGVSRKRILFMLLFEVCIILLLVLPTALLVGAGIFELMRVLYRTLCNTRLPDLGDIDSHVKMVTWHPQLCAVCVMSMSSLFAAGISAVRTLPRYPMMEVNSTILKREKNSRNRLRVRKSAVGLYCGEIHRKRSVSTIALLLNISVSIGLLFFGIRFLQEDFLQDTLQYNMYLEEHTYDFYGENTSIGMDAYYVETGHISGVSDEVLNTLISAEDVGASLAYGYRNSSRLVGVPVPDGLETYFEQNDARRYADEEDSDEQKGENAVYTQMGFNYQDVQLLTPTLVLPREQLSIFSESIAYGTLSPEQIDKGAEVAVLYTDELPVDVTTFLEVGQTLQISDCNPLEAAEMVGVNGDFYTIAGLLPAYEVCYEDEGGTYEYVAYCLGQRVAYEARIGALICVSDENLKQKLGLKDSKIVLLSTVSALHTHGIENQNYDQIYISLKDRMDVEQFAKLWYPSILSAGMQSYDIVQIQKKINQESYKDACVFYLLLLLTVVASMLGMMHSTRLLFVLQKKNFTILMALGMRRWEILKIKLTQQLWMLPAGCCISLIPALLFQVLIETAKAAQQSAGAGGISMVSLEDMVRKWYDYVPTGYDLLRGSWVYIWLGIAGIVFLILAAVIAVGHLTQKKTELQVELYCE